MRRRDDGEALVALNEDGVTRLSFAQLYDDVSRLVKALRAAGIVPGDRVAGVLPEPRRSSDRYAGNDRSRRGLARARPNSACRQSSTAWRRSRRAS